MSTPPNVSHAQNNPQPQANSRTSSSQQVSEFQNAYENAQGGISDVSSYGFTGFTGAPHAVQRDNQRGDQSSDQNRDDQNDDELNEPDGPGHRRLRLKKKPIEAPQTNPLASLERLQSALTESLGVTGVLALGASNSGVVSLESPQAQSGLPDTRFAESIARAIAEGEVASTGTQITFTDANSTVKSAIVRQGTDGSISVEVAATTPDDLYYVDQELADLRRRLANRGVAVRGVSAVTTNGDVIDIAGAETSE